MNWYSFYGEMWNDIKFDYIIWGFTNFLLHNLRRFIVIEFSNIISLYLLLSLIWIFFSSSHLRTWFCEIRWSKEKSEKKLLNHKWRGNLWKSCKVFFFSISNFLCSFNRRKERKEKWYEKKKNENEFPLCYKIEWKMWKIIKKEEKMWINF